MSINKIKYSILRMINYKGNADAARFQKSAAYVANPAKTSEGKWVAGQFMDPKDPIKSLRALESHWGNDKLTGRLFKHGIISFGSPAFKENEAMDLMELTLNYYKEYPLLWALHTDVANRLHAHFLLGMRNINTGKKFTQSKDDLKAFRLHYNKVAKEYGLLGLKDCKDSGEIAMVHVVDTFAEPMAYYPPPPPISEPPWPGTDTQLVAGTSQVPYQAQSTGQQLAAALFNDIREDFNDFFELGFEGGFFNGQK